MPRQAAKVKSRKNPSKFTKTIRNHGKDALNSLLRMARTPLSSTMTFVVIAAALLLPSLLFSLNANISQLLAQFQNNARVVLYLNESTTDSRGI